MLRGQCTLIRDFFFLLGKAVLQFHVESFERGNRPVSWSFSFKLLMDCKIYCCNKQGHMLGLSKICISIPPLWPSFCSTVSVVYRIAKRLISPYFMLGPLRTAVTLQNTWEPHSIATHVTTRDLQSHIAWGNCCFSFPSRYESIDG